MAQLIVRNVEQKIVRRLKQRAGEHGVSMEEEHRRILRATLLGRSEKALSFKQYLREMPDVGPDEVFQRDHDLGRKIEL
jgi:plasmid stability protein